MSTVTAGPSSCEPLQRRLKTRPTPSAVLWGHLLASNDAKIDSDRRGGHTSASLSTIAPVDKTGTSLRILLHDTQANLEKFSERVGKLTSDIDESKREIGAVKSLLQQDHEKTVEEIVHLVNRCQLEVQRSVGAPAQAERVEGVCSDLVRVDSRLTALEGKMDMLQMLHHTQLQALQTVQDQQGKLIAALSPVLPLLQGIAPHLENVRRDISDGFREVKSIYAGESRNVAAATQGAPLAQSPRGTPPSRSTPGDSSDPARRKKRKMGHDSSYSVRTPKSSGLPDSVRPPDTSTTGLTTNALASRTRLLAPSASPDIPLRLVPPTQTTYRTPRRPPLVDLLNLNATPGRSRTPLASTAQSGNSTQAADPAPSSVSTRAPPTLEGALNLVIDNSGAPIASKAPLAHGTPKNADSLASTTSTLSQSSIARDGSERKVTCDSSTSGVQSKAVADRLPISAMPPSGLDATLARQKPPRSLAMSGVAVLSAQNGSATPVMNKPLSIKDVRALTATPAFRHEGKRFIPLDDDDDDLVE